MNILERHITIMESYIDAPEVHRDAVLNPKMRGGPFMDFNGSRVPEVQSLYEDTLKNESKLIDFAKAVKSLDRLLLTETRGFGLESIYERIPPILKGYVEVFYDRNNNAGFRFFESLLYKSKYYSTKSQTIALWVTNNDHRPFCLSTPRLKENSVLQLNIPFNDSAIDELSKMKRTPNSLEFITERLGIYKSDINLFESFFTNQPPPI